MATTAKIVKRNAKKCVEDLTTLATVLMELVKRVVIQVTREPSAQKVRNHNFRCKLKKKASKLNASKIL